MIKVRIMASYPMIAIFVENDNQSFTIDSTAAAVDSKVRHWTIDHRVESWREFEPVWNLLPKCRFRTTVVLPSRQIGVLEYFPVLTDPRAGNDRGVTPHSIDQSNQFRSRALQSIEHERVHDFHSKQFSCRPPFN